MMTDTDFVLLQTTMATGLGCEPPPQTRQTHPQPSQGGWLCLNHDLNLMAPDTASLSHTREASVSGALGPCGPSAIPSAPGCLGKT